VKELGKFHQPLNKKEWRAASIEERENLKGEWRRRRLPDLVLRATAHDQEEKIGKFI